MESVSKVMKNVEWQVWAQLWELANGQVRGKMWAKSSVADRRAIVDQIVKQVIESELYV